MLRRAELMGHKIDLFLTHHVVYYLTWIPRNETKAYSTHGATAMTSNDEVVASYIHKPPWTPSPTTTVDRQYCLFFWPPGFIEYHLPTFLLVASYQSHNHTIAKRLFHMKHNSTNIQCRSFVWYGSVEWLVRIVLWLWWPPKAKTTSQLLRKWGQQKLHYFTFN